MLEDGRLAGAGPALNTRVKVWRNAVTGPDLGLVWPLQSSVLQCQSLAPIPPHPSAITINIVPQNSIYIIQC